jgi:hypothetical protein
MRKFLLLSVIVLTGCATQTQTVFIYPSCEVPSVPVLPKIPAGDLWDKVGQHTYDQLRDRETLIVDWSLQLKAMLVAACEKPKV